MYGRMRHTRQTLFEGPEGTLAIITEAVLRPVPCREDTAIVIGWFESYEESVDAIGSIGRSGVSPTMLEFVDRASLDAVERRSPTGFDKAVRGLLTDHNASEVLCHTTNQGTR